MKYPEIAIQALINTIDDDEEAYKWLTESKWKELAAFYDVLFSENAQAFDFLLKNRTNFSTIINFLAALQNEDKAFNLLMTTGDKQWAATVSSVHGKDDSYQWLENNNFIIFTKLADVLIQYKPTWIGSRSYGYGISGRADDDLPGSEGDSLGNQIKW